MDAFNLYSIILSVTAVVLFFLAAKNLRGLGKNSDRKSFSILLYAIIAIAVSTAICGVFVFVQRDLIIANIFITVNSLLLLIFVPVAVKAQQQELYEALKKENETNKYIAKLENTPLEESNRTQHILLTSRTLLNRTAASITGKKDISDIIYNYAATAFKDDLRADGVVLLIANGNDEIFSVKALIGNFPPPYKLPDDLVIKEDRVISNFKHAEFNYGETIFSRVAKSGTVLLIQEGSKSDLLPDNGEESFLQHGSLIFFPLISNEEIIGIIAVSRSANKPVFEKYDVKMGENLAGYVSEIINLGLTINEANVSAEIENIKDTASKIQSILLPKDFKKIPYLNISEYFLQAKGTCSDYYDVIPYKDKVLTVMSDVAGKSVLAAMIMIMIRAILYLIINSAKNTEDILNWMNKGITGKISIDHFARISIISYDPKQKTLEFVGAGTQSIMIWRKESKKIELFQQNTDPIGIDANSKYKSRTLPFNDGDVLAVYTDGIVETLNNSGEQYGIKRLASIIADNNADGPKEITKKIEQDIATFIGKKTIHDDHSLLIIKVKK